MQNQSVVVETSNASQAFSDIVYVASTVSSSTALVPNAVVVQKTSESFAIEFNCLSAKTALATLEMCKVVSEAKDELEDEEFVKFCETIGQKASYSTIRKYLAIGDRYDAFIAYADRLPNSWTSIYLITQIPSEQFDEVLKEMTSLKHLTAAQIKKIVSPNAEKSVRSAPSDAAVQIFFTKVPSATQWNTLKQRIGHSPILDEPQLPIRIEYSKKYIKLYNSIKKKNAKDARLERKYAKAAQKQKDERDYFLHPLFDYGDAYDAETGEFVR